VSAQSLRNRTLQVLITGFGPFPGAPCNPTELLVKRLARLRRPALADIRTIFHVFATSYAAIDSELPALVARHRPDAIVMFGLAARTKFIRIETLARNRTAAVFPDITRSVPKHGTINRRTGAIRGRAPFAQLAAAARLAGLSTRLSGDAGRYVCNYGYWRALETATHAGGPAVVVFVHVPSLRKRNGVGARSPSPTIEQLLRGAQAIVIAAAAAAKRGA
jgi:pyroglutamyl-peptidase